MHKSIRWVLVLLMCVPISAAGPNSNVPVVVSIEDTEGDIAPTQGHMACRFFCQPSGVTTVYSLGRTGGLFEGEQPDVGFDGALSEI